MAEPVKKYFRLFPGNEVRLKGAYFITCNSYETDEDGNVITKETESSLEETECSEETETSETESAE